jgi:integrase
MYDYSRDGITVSAMLDTRRPNSQGEYPVKVRVTYRRDRKYYGTGKNLTVEDWERLEASKSRTLIDIRESVRDSFDIVRDTVEGLVQSGAFTFDALNTRLRRATSDTVNTAFRAKIAILNAADQVGNAGIYDNVLKGIERYAGGKIGYDAVTIEWVRRYEQFLTKEGKSVTTISIHLRTIRAILNDAKRTGTIKESQYPFGKGKYEIKAGTGRKMALTLDQIGQIARYDDGSDTTAKYRDYWLFLYLCNGINMADFVRLRYRDIENGEIYFVRQKTQRTNRMRREIRAIVTPEVQAIIDLRGNPPGRGGYIFPILNGGEDAITVKNKTKYATRAINKRMATIGEALGIGTISTYTARHSYATVLKRSGANIAYISESLGHADLKTTENYLASFEREERQKNAELLTKF